MGDRTLSLPRGALALVSLCVLALAACRAAEPATEVLVHVDSDLLAGSELKELRLQVFDRKGTEPPSEERTILLVPDGGLGRGGRVSENTWALPVRFSVYPQQGATDFRIVVGAIPNNPDEPGQAIVERQAITSFTPGKQTFLPIFLARVCVKVLCTEMGKRSDKTCVDGQCVEVPVVLPQPEKLFDAGPTPTVKDAGTDAAPLTEGGPPPADGGPGDGGPTPQADGAVDAAADAAVDAAVDAGSDADTAEGGVVDAGPPDAGPPDAGPPDAGPPDAGPPDAGPVDAGPCGTWVTSDKDSGPPAGATAYGHEDTMVPPFSFDQYVCRARASVGSTEFLPGKGVYPYGCFFTQVDNVTKGNADEGFEILTGTAGCAQRVSIESYLVNRPALIPTGYGVNGKAYYSCVASETSAVLGMPLARPLGRYIEDPPGTHDCVYEWETTTHRQSVHGAPGTSFEVLVRR